MSWIAKGGSLLGSKELGTNVLELHFVMLANYDKNILHEVRSIDRALQKLNSNFLQLLDSNFTHKHTLSKSKIRLKHFDHSLPTLQNEVLIHLNLKS